MLIAIVRLRQAGQLINCKPLDGVSAGDYIVVEADRGLDYGEVVEIKEVENIQPLNQDGDDDGTIKIILRKVSGEDMKQITINKQSAKDAMRICSRKAREYKLIIKLVDAEYSFDRKKIVFYFTSETRVDFRELVKELAKIFKIRIEMRQIGVRDEARIFGGVGPCGQSLCCIRFLKSFEPVSMKMAKQQKLPLTSSKISGICGRLMCCLFYEYKTYKDFAKGLPKEGQIIDTAQGKGKVVSINILKRIVNTQLEDGRYEKVSFGPCPGCSKEGLDKPRAPQEEESNKDENK
jgi:cell fate regulator YaaT (PSP1 superfamily)